MEEEFDYDKVEHAEVGGFDSANTLHPEKQAKSKVKYIQPYQWKKGQSGNPAGRPKGKTMKEYARELLECQSEEERQAFLHGLPKEVIWKMAEGNPENRTDITSKGEKITLSPEHEVIAKKYEDEIKESL